MPSAVQLQRLYLASILIGPYSWTPQPVFFPCVWSQVSYQRQSKRQIYSSAHFNPALSEDGNIKDSRPNGWGHSLSLTCLFLRVLYFMVLVLVHCSCIVMVHVLLWCFGSCAVLVVVLVLFLYCVCALSLFIVLVLCYPNWGLFNAFPSVIRQMSGYNSQRRGTARTSRIVLSMYCVLFVVNVSCDAATGCQANCG